jgi:hypothetical protein
MFAPPLAIDRAPILAARVAKYRERMGRAKTTLTVEQTLAAVQSDKDIGRKPKEELKRYGARRIGILREWKGSGERKARPE